MDLFGGKIQIFRKLVTISNIIFGVKIQMRHIWWFSTHCSKSQIFVQKLNFDKTPTFSRVFHPIFFLQFFSWNQSFQQLKSPKPQHFHEFFTPKNRQFPREIKVEFLDKKWRFWTVWLRWFTCLIRTSHFSLASEICLTSSSFFLSFLSNSLLRIECFFSDSSKAACVRNRLSCSNSIRTCSWTFSLHLSSCFEGLGISGILWALFFNMSKLQLSSIAFTASSISKLFSSVSLFLNCVQKPTTVEDNVANLTRKSFFSVSNWAARELEVTKVSKK